MHLLLHIYTTRSAFYLDDIHWEKASVHRFAMHHSQKIICNSVPTHTHPHTQTLSHTTLTSSHTHHTHKLTHTP